MSRQIKTITYDSRSQSRRTTKESDTCLVRFGEEGDLTPRWEIILSSPSLAAGICAGGQGILYELNTKKNKRYTLTADVDISYHRLALDYSSDFIVSTSATLLQRGEYGLWLRGYTPYRYSLYRFTDPSFLQGVISICHHFNVDFRNYLFGLPFDSSGTLYTLSGYRLLSSFMSQDIRDDPEADEEDWDDENIIQPYNSMEDLPDYEVSV